MAESYPKLRSDLEIRPESAAPDSPVVLKDPITRRFYRFASVQASALQYLDGTCSFESVARSVSEKHQIRVEPAQIEDFAGKLQNLLLLDSPISWSKLDALRKKDRRLLGNLLSIKLKAFNPDATLSRLERRLAFCFTRGFAAITWISIAAALVISILNWRSLFVSFGTLLSLYSLPLIFAVAFVVMTIHEFGHGLALKHFGGKVEEMGLMILYFIPGFYCNVSDAWMLKKRQRLRVTLAGGYIQLFVWALATIAWRLLATETFISRVCLIAIAFSGIQALINFNPLIRLDGYYILSDYLEIPNLRAKAFGYLKKKTWGWFLSGRQSGAAASRREKRILAIYGTASFLFSAALLWIMALNLGSWIVRQYQTWGIALIVIICLIALPAGSKADPEPRKVASRSIVDRLKKVPVAVVVIAAAVVVGFFPWELKISGEFTVLPTQEVSVNPQIDGTLKAIYADEGDRVRTGDVLAVIENLDLSNAVEDTKGELMTQRATRDLLKAGTRPEEIERTRRLVATKNAELFNAARVEQERRMLSETIAKKQAQLDNAQTSYERTRRLFDEGLIARSDMDRDRTAYEVSRKELSEAQGQLKVLEERTDRDQDLKKKELDQAKSELDILLAGSRKESIDAVRAQVNKLREKLNILTQQLEYLKIRSPIDGVVSTPRLRNRIGEYVSKGSAFCSVVSEGMVIVDMPVPEKEIADVKAGFPITMKVRGYPKLSFEARVKTIAPVAMEKDSERMVVVRGELQNPDGILKAGMTGVGKILCGKRKIAELVTRRFVRWLRTEFWEYLP